MGCIGHAVLRFEGSWQHMYEQDRLGWMQGVSVMTGQCDCRHGLMMRPVRPPLAGTSKTHKLERSLTHYLSCVHGRLTIGLQAVSIAPCWQRIIRIAGACFRHSDWDRLQMNCRNWNKTTQMRAVYTICSGHQFRYCHGSFGLCCMWRQCRNFVRM